VGAAGGIAGNAFLAEGAGARLRLGLLRIFALERVDVADNHENGKGNDCKFNNGTDKRAVAKCHCIGGFRGSSQDELLVGKVNIAGQETYRWEDDILNQGSDNLRKAGPDDDTDSQVDGITTDCKLFEFINYFHPVRDICVLYRYLNYISKYLLLSIYYNVIIH